MHRRTSLALRAAILVLLLLSLYVQVWVVPATVDNTVATFPEFEPLAVPSIIWSVVSILCLQAVLVAGWRLVALSSHTRMIDADAFTWLRWAAGFLIAFTALAAFAFVALSILTYTAPSVILALIGGELITALTAACLLGFMAYNKPIPATPAMQAPLSLG
ncbi:hypothetical protein JOE65_000858 [Arthrobacter roseus]|nr:hypothetical protein [Arthrobacter roseus]